MILSLEFCFVFVFCIFYKLINYKRKFRHDMLNDGRGVGVVIRSVKRHDLVKIKQRSRKQSFLLRLRFRRLRSSENQFVGVVSRSGRTKPITKRGNEHCDCLSFRFCFRLRQSGFHWIVSDGIVSGVGRKWKRSDSSYADSVELMTPLTTAMFDFHLVISALTTPLTTPTPSLVKTSLKNKLHIFSYSENLVLSPIWAWSMFF